MQKAASTQVFKKTLSNGMTILVRPTHIIPKVSIQLWYNVGSKDEKSGQKGIAHLIEHMIFKGTKKLTESDINLITHKLSGYCNAFTSYDYTGYLFDFPSQHWYEALPIMADCMRNCTFKEEFLNSELKAVIQELKMYRDDYPSTLIENMVSTIFNDHPYHYPIIGYKHDLWSLKRDKLVAFYQEHYIPNNATLVIVGDVDTEDAFTSAQKAFEHIPANPNYTKEEYYYTPDIGGKSVRLYRDIQQPFAITAYVIPGAKTHNEYTLDVLSYLLGLGKSSILQKKLIHELQLVTDLEVFTYDLFDHSVLFIYFQPKNIQDTDKIISLIQKELDTLVSKGIAEHELQRAAKQAHTHYLSILEDTQKQAYCIGQVYTATKDEQAIFKYGTEDLQKVKKEITSLTKDYLRPSLMHKGLMLPLEKEDQDLSELFQHRSDQEDARVLSRITREAIIEEGVHVNTVVPGKPKPFDFPKAKKITLSNGLTVLYFHNPNIPKIEIAINLRAKHYYDPDDMQGLNAFMSAMLTEGTKKHDAIQLADKVESNGMSFRASAGFITVNMLSQDFKKGLDLLHEIVTESTFPTSSVEKVRAQILATVRNYWDNPSQFAGQIAKEYIYQNHPYSKYLLGNEKTINSIKQENLIHFYKKHMTPDGAVLAIVGDLQEYDIPVILGKTIGAWQGPSLEPITFPELQPVEPAEINYTINRDQVVLSYAGLSIRRNNQRFDKILLFDQVLTGGVLGSMSSRLFQLREQSGLFYTIAGSLLLGVDEQPGMVFIKTIVSKDRLEEAEKAIENEIDTACNKLLDHELEQAKNAIVNSLVNYFEANANIASTFLFLEKYNLPEDYFDTRATQLMKVSKEEILAATRDILDIKKMIKVRIGRV